MNFHRNNNFVHNSGFSLVEVTIAMAIAAIALISLIGILPTAMKGTAEGGDQMAIGTMLEDIHDRIEGSEFEAGPVANSPFFYDQRGVYFDPNQVESPTDSIITEKFYRVEVELVDPPNESEFQLEGTLAVKVAIYWPINEEGEAMLPNEPGSIVTYMTTARTGPNWEEIDPTYQPRIEY